MNGTQKKRTPANFVTTSIYDDKPALSVRVSVSVLFLDICSQFGNAGPNNRFKFVN